MSGKQFEQLARRLETYAQTHPAQYKVTVALVAALGYASVLAVLGSMLALGSWLFLSLQDNGVLRLSLIARLIGLSLFAALILRACWVRLSPPSGFEVQREEAPRLFLLVDKLTNALDTPPIHQVFIMNELRASVAQTPRFGLFGRHQNTLLLGLPLMLTMTPVQFRALLAHEFSHLSRRHDRFAAWIYRTRMVWSRLLEELAARARWSSFFSRKLLSWYAPCFNACAFALARMQEYEADRQAARLVGPGCMKDALATMQIMTRLMDDLYWPALNRLTITNPTPPASHLDELITIVQRPLPRDTVQKWLSDAMQRTTGYTDTHPALADRLAAIDQLPEKPDSPVQPADFPHLRDPHEGTAANFYLGTHATATREALDHLWADSVADKWNRKHQEMAAARARCQALSDKSATVGLSISELWEYACQMEALESAAAAIPLLQELLTKQPDHAAANLAIGRLLLAQNDQAGLPYLEKALAADPGSVIPACQLASSFLERRGNHTESMRYRVRAQRQRQQLLDAETERRSSKPEASARTERTHR